MTLSRHLACGIVAALILSGCEHAKDPYDVNVVEDCTAPVKDRLVAMGLDAGAIDEIGDKSDNAIRGGQTVFDRHVAVHQTTCTGYLMVRVDSTCKIRDIYSTGSCAVPKRTAS